MGPASEGGRLVCRLSLDGSLQGRVDASRDGTTVGIFVGVGEESLREEISRLLPDIRQALIDDGVPLGRLEVGLEQVGERGHRGSGRNFRRRSGRGWIG